MNLLNLSGCFILCLLAMLCPVETHADSETKNRITQLDMPFRLREYESVAILKIKDYVQPVKPGARRLLKQMNCYFPKIEQILKAKRMPDFLKYIPVAESRLSISVVSPQGAAGLWQLMPNTARNYGLEVSEHKDERLDPERATEAALNFLQDLYYEFGDWTLALAAYNCGSGKVKKAIKRMNCRNYHEIKMLLPKQTRCYLPSLLAAAYLDSYFRKKPQPVKDDRKSQTSQKVASFSPFYLNFFKNKPPFAFEPAKKNGSLPFLPTIFIMPALVQTRPEPELLLMGNVAC